ncbi:MAG: hypothetical protein KatS3mg105_1749 [Gemmatales bacterium]|nr:MAG: hypothetical protein KatS3mg105_1749 [Gemmatales bacterium]
MNVKLVVEEGESRSQVIVLRGGQATIGRHRDCEIRVPYADVSRHHCVLRVEDGLLTVEDLGSLNGTLVNGEKTIGKQVVRPGDHLQIGPVTFSVQYPVSNTAVELHELAMPLAAEVGSEDSATVDVELDLDLPSLEALYHATKTKSE